MSYPRNAVSPERIAIGVVVQISDGAVQTSGVAVKVVPFGGSEASGTGTVAYSADGVVLYTPVQAETNYTSFVLIASKSGCIPASTTVVTSAESTAGLVRAASVTGSVGSVTGSVGSVVGNVGGNVNGSVASVAGNIGGNVAGNVSGSVGSVTGAVGSVTGSVGSVVGNVGGSVASVAGSVGSVTGNLGGDVAGKVLGGGAGTISGDGVRAASVTGAVGSVTGSVGSVVGAVELDSAARVKLDATQPDYAPATAAALATTYALLQLTDTDVAAIEARLPSDPADQSAVEAAITAATSPLATSSALSTAAGNITTILGKFTGITLLARWLGALAGKTADTTTRTEINATTAGAGYNETTDSQEAIRDRGDAAWITGSGSGGAGGSTTIVTLQAAAGISPGVIVGPSEPLVIGDDYLTVMNRSVRINLLDENGDPAEVEYGTYALDDAGISIQMLLAKSGKPSVEALIVGTCTFFPAVDDIPPYLIVEFTKVETAKAIPGPYDMQVEAVWGDGKTVTFAPYGQIQFTRDIGRRT